MMPNDQKYEREEEIRDSEDIEITQQGQAVRDNKLNTNIQRLKHRWRYF